MNGVIYLTVIAALQDDLGNAFIKRYKDRFGAVPSSLARRAGLRQRALLRGVSRSSGRHWRTG